MLWKNIIRLNRKICRNLTSLRIENGIIFYSVADKTSPDTGRYSNWVQRTRNPLDHVTPSCKSPPLVWRDQLRLYSLQILLTSGNVEAKRHPGTRDTKDMH